MLLLRVLLFAVALAGLLGGSAQAAPVGGLKQYKVPTADSQPRAIVNGSDGNRWFTLGTEFTDAPPAIARMAFEAGAVVQPAMRMRRRHRVFTELGPPLDARRFGGWEELHAALAAAHDRWMRPYPWAHEIPIRLLPD
jgi:hypothetical protein